MTSSTQCAEALNYGPEHTLTEASSAHFSTAHKDEPHLGFRQILAPYGDPDPYNATNMVIDWYFPGSSKTLKERWVDAVVWGEECVWVIQYDGSTHVKSGTWWFSDAAGNMASRFETEFDTCCFSSDDGLYGGGTGVVNGDESQVPGDFFGHGNFNGGDSGCSSMYAGGSVVLSSSSMKSFMYLRNATLPPSPTSAPTASPTVTGDNNA